MTHQKDEGLLAYLRLARTPGVGPVHFQHLIHRFKTPQEALKRLQKSTTRKEPLCSIAAIEQEYERCQASNIQLIHFFDPRYPAMLKAIPAPPVISALGNLDLLERNAIAIVGSRNASFLGLQTAAHFAEKLSEEAVIVSGLALGIDTKAHEHSLERGTIAVLAQGIDVPYPPKTKHSTNLSANKGYFYQRHHWEQNLSLLFFQGAIA